MRLHQKLIFKKNIQNISLHAIKYIMALFLIIMFIGCSDEVDEKEKSVNKTESYEMLYAKDKTATQITLQHSKNGIGLLVQKQDKQSFLQDNAIKIIAFFPKDCSMCVPTLIHLNNLLNRNKFLQVVVISDKALHTSNYRDFPMALNTQIVNLVDVNKKFDLLLDSIKRALNIEIRDYKAPIFLIQDTSNVILQSIEGAVLEEIFEQIISQLLAQESMPDSKQNQQIPNNTLSQTAPSITPPINTDKGE